MTAGKAARRTTLLAVVVALVSSCTGGGAGSDAGSGRATVIESNTATSLSPASTIIRSATSDVLPTIPTTSVTTTTSVPLRNRHDAVFDTMMAEQAAALSANDRDAFLAGVDPALQPQLGAWFANTRALGVEAAAFARVYGYYSTQDTVSTFSRDVVLGVRTPYDEADSIPGITYTVTLTKSGSSWQLTGWRTAYVDDPMNCSCTLTVTHYESVAVVTDGSADLDAWAPEVAEEAVDSTDWINGQLRGSSLTPSRGHVFFLTATPQHWFLNITDPAEESNTTVPLITAAGAAPGRSVSGQSRIVLTLSDSKGAVLPLRDSNRLYVSDIATHESIHQLMGENGELNYDSPEPLSTWIPEGIAVAVEVLHRRARYEETVDIGYPEPNDPYNVAPEWLAAHADGILPTREQLYESDPRERHNWYALAGSVFLYLDDEYGFDAMMDVAKQVYARNNQEPFEFFADPESAGQYLTPEVAKAAWLQWFTDTYVQ